MDFLSICLGFFLFFFHCSVIFLLNSTASKLSYPNCPSEIPEYSCPKWISIFNSIFTFLNITLARQESIFYRTLLLYNEFGACWKNCLQSHQFYVFSDFLWMHKPCFENHLAEVDCKMFLVASKLYFVIVVINMMAVSLQQEQKQKIQINGYTSNCSCIPSIMAEITKMSM